MDPNPLSWIVEGATSLHEHVRMRWYYAQGSFSNKNYEDSHDFNLSFKDFGSIFVRISF